MGAPKKWLNEQIAQALRESRGMPSVAARRLGCSHNTVLRAIKSVASVRQAKEEALAAMADTVENTLYRMAVGIPAGNKKITLADGREFEVPDYAVEPNMTALIFLTKTHPALRARGYTERHEVGNEDGKAFKIIVVNEQRDRNDE